MDQHDRLTGPLVGVIELDVGRVLGPDSDVRHDRSFRPGRMPRPTLDARRRHRHHQGLTRCRARQSRAAPADGRTVKRVGAESGCCERGGHGILHLPHPVVRDERDRRAAESATGHARADGTRRECGIDGRVELGHRDLEVVAHRGVRGDEQVADRGRAALGQSAHGVEHALVLGDDVADAPEGDVVHELGRAGEVRDRDVAKRRHAHDRRRPARRTRGARRSRRSRASAARRCPSRAAPARRRRSRGRRPSPRASGSRGRSRHQPGRASRPSGP